MVPATGDAAATSVESGDVEVVVDAGRRLEMDAAGLPTGRLLAPRRPALDDVLLDLAREPVVGWPGGPSLTLRCAEAAAWVVYAAHPDGVCVEPLTGAPDGLNGGPLGPPPVARPGSPLVATFEIAWG